MKKAIAVLFLFLCIPVLSLAADIPDINSDQLGDLLEKNRGKVVILNFFATWCPPCRVELPELVKLRDTYPESDLYIASFSVDENKNAVPSFVEQAGINYPVFMVNKNVTDKFGISSVPHNAFFAPDGKLIYSEPGIAELPLLKEVVDNLKKGK